MINIKNTHGDEEFTKSGDNLIWDADGADIYYQGESQKKLPIDCSVKYELDGEEISAKDLVGKSGKVKIIVKYKNKDEHIVNIQGRDTKLYTPFVVVCGTILDNTNHKNIEVSNGKIVNDGNKTFVLGMAFPGLKESLDISSDKVDFPDTVEMTMEANEFEIGNIASFITPKLLEEEELSTFDDLDEMYNKVNTLESSSKELENGANTLKSGVDTFYEKSQEFNSAMKEVSKGANTIYKSYTELDDGINTLNDGTNELKDGAKKLDDGAKELKDGAKNLNAGLKTAGAGVKELSTGLNAAYNSLTGASASTKSTKTGNSTSEIKDALEDATKPIIDNVGKLVVDNNTVLGADEKLLNEQIKLLNEQKRILQGLTPQTEEITAQITAIDSQVVAINKQIGAIKTQVATNTGTASALNSSLGTQLDNAANAIQAQISEQIKVALGSINAKLPALIEKLKEAADGAKALDTSFDKLILPGSEKLTNGTMELSNGAKDLYKGTETLSDGAKALSEGSKEMKDGLSTLDNGATELSNANDQLTDGAGTISNGAKTLADGVNRFNTEGINKVCSYINGDVKDMTERVEKLKDLANEYKTFTMLNDSTEGSVKFIMLMDGISIKDMQKEEIILNQDKDDKKEN